MLSSNEMFFKLQVKANNLVMANNEKNEIQ